MSKFVRIPRYGRMVLRCGRCGGQAQSTGSGDAHGNQQVTCISCGEYEDLPYRDERILAGLPAKTRRKLEKAWERPLTELRDVRGKAKYRRANAP